jgi:hypothetical protein
VLAIPGSGLFSGRCRAFIQRINGGGDNSAHGVLSLFAVIQFSVTLRNTTYGLLRS